MTRYFDSSAELEAHYAGKYPECYLHVHDCRCGDEWVRVIRGNSLLDLKRQLKLWAKDVYGSMGYNPKIGEIMPRLEGDYYAQIITDARSPYDGICWTGGGFYLTLTEG